MGCDWGSLSANVCQRLTVRICDVVSLHGKLSNGTKSAGGNNQSCCLPKNLGVAAYIILEGPKQGHHGNCDDECNEVEGKTYAHKVGKLVVAHTLHNEVGLIANGGAKTS